MTSLRQRMVEDMRLKGLSVRTQEAYVRSVRQLAEHFAKSPDLVTEEELREYFLHVIQVREWARASVTIALCGIKFFFTVTLGRPLGVLGIIRPPRQTKLPVVLAREEVHKAIGAVTVEVYRVCLTLLYCCGLRLNEGRLLPFDRLRAVSLSNRRSRTSTALACCSTSTARVRTTAWCHCRGWLSTVSVNSGGRIARADGCFRVERRTAAAIARTPTRSRSRVVRFRPRFCARFVRPASRRRRTSTRCVTRTRPICSRMASASASSRFISAIAAFARPRSIRI